jgi:predicted naringenin-chalcone synthase
MVVIRSIETAVPPTVLDQSALRDLLAAQPGYGRLGRRLVTAAFDASAIETRHSVIEEFGAGAGPQDPAFLDRETNRILSPGTGERNDKYIEHSKTLVVEAARRALAGAPDLDPSDVTHVVTVSCTGFYAPGPDYVVVRELGLKPSTQRYHLGFLGCYGVFPALRAAKQFCEADPEAVVLVVSVELCSLHVHVDDDPDAIVAASVFADGAAAAVVTSRPAPSGSTVIDLDVFETVVIPEGEGDMAWSIGDRGFDMVLSSYVPRIVEANIRQALVPLFDRDVELAGVDPRDVPLWAVHPGGRSILDRVESTLGLSDEQMRPSRDVLCDYGNMSSATVLFILRSLLDAAGRESEPVLALAGAGSLVGAATDSGAEAQVAVGPGSGIQVKVDSGPVRLGAMAFGPGLTVETALMTLRRQD